MAIYHCSIKIISRGKGKSAVAAAAYRSGEKLTNDYDGLTHDYTKKGGIVHTEIILPPHAPPDFSNRSILWNSVEEIERSKNSQLAREIEIAIPKELSREQQISLVREYVKNNFVDCGMCADFAIHDKSDGNPHAHIMLTMRPLEENGQWGAKSKKEYITDENGERIILKNGNFKSRKVDTVDWNYQSKAEQWRSAWAEISNKYLAENMVSERIDHRSFERQGTDKIPTIHLGVAASQMERKGIVTGRGNLNREIIKANKIFAEIKSKISALKKWIEKLVSQKNEVDKSEDLISILTQKNNANQTYWQKINSIKNVAKVVKYLQETDIRTLPQLQEKIKALRDEHFAVKRKLLSVEKKIKINNENLKQADIYFETRPIIKKYNQLKSKDRENFYNQHTADIMLYDSAVKFLKKVIVHGKIPTTKWKADIEILTAEKNTLYTQMYKLRDEVKAVESIKRTVDDLSRQGRTQNRNHNKDMGI